MTRNPTQYLPDLARKYADDTRPRKRGGPWSWTDAMARAPWSVKLPADHELEFRRAYAERLVERGLALRVGRSRTSGPSGETDLERCIVYLSAAERNATRALADAAGLSWSSWARRKLTAP